MVSGGIAVALAGMNSERERVERRLAEVLAADVAGYSRLMGADEEGTHATLTALCSGAASFHRGRLLCGWVGYLVLQL
jgi:hypothetical protein